MNVYAHWQDIIFLPVINSLVEEQVQHLESAQHRATNEVSTNETNTTLSIDLTPVDQLYQQWEKHPHKTVRQIEWLHALKGRMQTLNALSAQTQAIV